ncbi:MAG: YdiU family protein [Pseudomonadota bacterium]
MTTPLPFDNSYVKLPERFFSRQAPEPVSEPGAIRSNKALARFLGIDSDWLESAEGVAAIAGNTVPDGAEPIATVYAGHQFGSWNPQLGDGRAVLLGEVVAADGLRYDIQLKGSGRTPYSRGGDGRAPLGPVLREYVVSEAMHAIGIPTTRSLAAVTTGDTVYRDEMLPGGVLARVARSHIRFGTFQFFSAREDREALEQLVAFCLERHYPEQADSSNGALALLTQVIAAQAALVARWQTVGFIHGVMNTDNMLVGAETIDYGPCAFMDSFNPAQVYSSIDHGGRYAYENQPGICHWNLACFAQTLLPLLDDDADVAVQQAQAALDRFPQQFLDAHQHFMGDKLGLTLDGEEDEQLVQDLLALMAETSADFTLSFRALTDHVAGDTPDHVGIGDVFSLPETMADWIARWEKRARSEGAVQAARLQRMLAANPVFIPRNHQVEACIRAAEDAGDFSVFHKLVERLADPFTYDPADRHYALAPKPEEVVRQTFCGT